ncbi:phosphoribosylformylglycinamidine cyclo-ligase [Desulfovibrio sp. OttesenSCG-928-G11]|nr:phosphoribosylformylglycinamidine cyclo-ligase [Desulfovibrio sp. OttesenSCG-928-G11]
MSSSKERSRAYTDAGVDIDAGNQLVERIKAIVATTQTRGVLSGIGGFGGLYKPDMGNVQSPVLVAATDGVGTKLKLAFAWNRHEGVGIDLVAMSVNDIVVQGAKPLFFLDYFATGKLDIQTAEQVIAGIGEGCRQAQCALLGGESAEMPAMYADGEYDLAGFCVGLVDNSRIVDGSSVKVGDSVIGIASSGPHANGYSLIRKLLAQSGLGPDDPLPDAGQSVADAFMAPTVIYSDCVRNLLRDFSINGMAHITGGGFYDNIPRVLPAQVRAIIDFSAWPMPAVFRWLKREGKLSWPEMLQIFNCGIGFVLIVPEEQGDDVLRRVAALQLNAWKIGMIEHCPDQDLERVEIVFPARK